MHHLRAGQRNRPTVRPLERFWQNCRWWIPKSVLFSKIWTLRVY